MYRIRYSIYLCILSALSLLALAGCVDDNLGFDSLDPDGKGMLDLTVSFQPMADGDLTRATLAPPGRGMNRLNDLVVLVYDTQGNLLADYMTDVDFNPSDVKDEPRDESDTSDGKAPAESDTKCLGGIRMPLPFGEYHIVAVANIGKYSAGADGSAVVVRSTYEVLTEDYADDIATLDGLRSIRVTWQSDNYLDNCGMLGYFAEPDAQAPRASSTFPKVRVNRPDMQLKARMRRCASKITIDFDGSGLRDNIYVYIKDARIYDIPRQCTLGFGTAGVLEEELRDYNNRVTSEEGLLATSGHHIDYGEGDDYHNWPCITRGNPAITDTAGDTVDFHAQDRPALFFYENMQGEAPYDKVPHADLEQGGAEGADREKDGVEYGTYIEVTAHYHSDAQGNITDGDIKYRFMIGKDALRDCNAERNYHFKLTLRLRGNANDYDWHIDYRQEEGFDVPNPWYVSYLYGHNATLPFKYTPPEGWEVTGLRAEIIKNPWYPSDIDFDDLSDPTIPIVPCTPYGDELDAAQSPYSTANKNYWNTGYNSDGTMYNKANGHGFLSLRYENKTAITNMDANGTATWPGYNDNNAAYNNDYYRGLNGRGDGIDKSKRIYMADGKEVTPSYPSDFTPEDKEKEAFHFRKEGMSTAFDIPLFTRPKVMVKETGYTGNNPFVGYQRVARVTLTVTLKKTGTDQTMERSENVNVVQVRRVVNPKGVYRRAGNNDPFNVRLMWLDSDDAKTFTPVKSHGPWKAEIIGDANFITLNGRNSVSGKTESEINFTIQFNRMNTSETGVRSAVVRIRYHNYTCTHLIFVRQGYEPQELVPPEDCLAYGMSQGKPVPSAATPVKWHIANMLGRDAEATDPRDEGSLFKFGNSSQPIHPYNNVYRDAQGNTLLHNLTESEFAAHMERAVAPFRLADPATGALAAAATTTNWGEIETDVNGFDTGKMAKVATMHHFEQLYLSRNMHFGYGVLYADGATQTAENVSDAYGYYGGDGGKSQDSPKGMRGMFAYYWDGKDAGGSTYNARNIFFPIGRSGYGHRKNKKELEANNGKGVLRYSSNRGWPEPTLFKTSAPLFVFLYRRPGAIYWSRNIIPSGQCLGWDGLKSDGDAYGLDINYFSLDVNYIQTTNVDSGNDACFVRCVTE